MIIDIILFIAGIYLLSGILFSVPFLIKGVTAIDEGAHGAKLGFKIIIIPGTIVFWPLLLKKWLEAKNK